jgi:hypothetical protein
MQQIPYLTFTTAELLRYVIKNFDNPDGSTVEAVIYNGAVKVTHFFDYLEDKGVFEHEGCGGGREKLKYAQIIQMYPTTTWCVHLEPEEDVTRWAVFTACDGIVDTTELPIYPTEEIARTAAIRAIDHQESNDWRTKPKKNDKKNADIYKKEYENCRKQVMDGKTLVALPEQSHGDGNWDVYIRPIKTVITAP